jgi:hypothetical protein
VPGPARTFSGFTERTVANAPDGVAVGEGCAVGEAVGGNNVGVSVGGTGVELGVAVRVGGGAVGVTDMTPGAGVALAADTILGRTAVKVAKILVMMTASVAEVSDAA